MPQLPMPVFRDPLCSRCGCGEREPPFQPGFVSCLFLASGQALPEAGAFQQSPSRNAVEGGAKIEVDLQSRPADPCLDSCLTTEAFGE